MVIRLQIGSNERAARGPVHQNMTIEEHLQQSMESPAVRILGEPLLLVSTCRRTHTLQ